MANKYTKLIARQSSEKIVRSQNRDVIDEYLSEDTKEEIADSLLQESGALGKDCYTEQQMNWQDDHHGNYELSDDNLAGVVPIDFTGTAQCSIRKALKHAGANWQVIRCVILWNEGWTSREIAEKQSVGIEQMSYKTAQRRIKKGLELLRNNPYIDIVEVLMIVFKMSRENILQIIR